MPPTFRGQKQKHDGQGTSTPAFAGNGALLRLKSRRGSRFERKFRFLLAGLGTDAQCLSKLTRPCVASRSRGKYNWIAISRKKLSLRKTRRCRGANARSWVSRGPGRLRGGREAQRASPPRASPRYCGRSKAVVCTSECTRSRPQ